jgi:hypothetical protein
MPKRDISAGIRARQRSMMTAAAESPEGFRGEPPSLADEPSHHIVVKVPVSLDDQIEEQLLRVNRAARDAGRAGFTKRRFIELALRDLVRTPPAEILARAVSGHS